MIILKLIYIIASLYLLGKICDKYFVTSLDIIAKKLNLPSDVAGATLMAIGSSAPELFIALFAVFVPGNHQEIGVGTIIGSALFNILGIIGVVGLIKKSNLQWKSIVRDLSFYFLSVLLLVVTFLDGNITIIEAIIYVILYIIYVIIVIKSRKWIPEQKNDTINNDDNTENSFDTFKIHISQKNYVVIFLLSIVLIAFLSWSLVENSIDVAHYFNIPEAIIAITILAIGTSIPDLISSAIVAKKGLGGMGVSNAIGSNIFDILVGLGLPWIIFSLIQSSSIHVGNASLTSSSIVLLGSIVIIFIIIAVNKWKIGKVGGIILIALYFAYIIWELLKVNL